MNKTLEIIYRASCEDGTYYVLEPHPEFDPEEGFKFGALLSYNEKRPNWVQENEEVQCIEDMRISPEAYERIGYAFLEAAKSIKNNENI